MTPAEIKTEMSKMTHDNTVLDQRIAELEAENDRLRKLINSTPDCPPECDSYGHDEKCMNCDPLAVLEDENDRLQAVVNTIDKTIDGKPVPINGDVFIRNAKGRIEKRGICICIETLDVDEPWSPDIDYYAPYSSEEAAKGGNDE